MSGEDEEYGQGEVLTGAELYLYLLRQNEEQLERANSKLHEYTALKETLQVLTERSRRRVLAPVAGGLAYFPAELNATNTITVLLGDSWFAERSAVQAAEIAGRRIDFLRREAEVLKQEQATLRSKQELFLSEMPEAQSAVAQLLAEKDSQHAELQHTAAAAATAALADPASAAASGVGVTGAASAAEVSARPSPPVSLPAGAEAGVDAGMDYASIDAALATFDEQDELTVDELIALEKELGDRLDDDDYVEQVMTERMIEKKERRVREELARRQAAAVTAAAVDDSTLSAMTTLAAPRVAAGTDPVNAAVAAVPPQAPGVEKLSSSQPASSTAFRTPGDIGGWGVASSAAAVAPSAAHVDPAASSVASSSSSLAAAVAPVRPPTSSAVESTAAAAAAAAVASPTGSTSSSSSRKERHVHFHADVVREPEATVSSASAKSSAAVAPSAATSFSSSSLPSATAAGDVPPPPSSSSLLRSTYKIGDIVEHAEAEQSAAVPPPMLPLQRQKPKRKSLFMRDLEGDDA